MAIPKVGGGSRLIWGLGQDAVSDDSVDVDNTDLTEPETTEEDVYEEEAPTDEETYEDEAPADEELEEEDTDEEEITDEEADPGLLSDLDLAALLASGLELTSAGVKTAMALGIIKKPAASGGAAQATQVSSAAQAVHAVQTGRATAKGAPMALLSKKNLPLLALASVAVLVLLRKK